jgi:hypothetical protein
MVVNNTKQAASSGLYSAADRFDSVILHRRLRLPNDFFSSGNLTKILYAFLTFDMCATRPTHYILLDLITLTYLTNHFARSNTGIVGSNPTHGMDVCLRLFCVCVVLCRHRSCVGLIPRPRCPTDCLRLRN